MSLLFLPFFLLGLGAIVYAAISWGRGRRRPAGPLFAAGGALTALSFAVGAIAGQSQNATQAAGTHMAGSHTLAITAPTPNEQLDLQDFLLEGTGPAGATLDVLEGDAVLGTTPVDANGAWAYPITPKAEGDQGYSVRIQEPSNVGGAISRIAVNVAKGRNDASNAKCPCRLRVFLTNAPSAKIMLLKDGQSVGEAENTNVTLFGKLDEGQYTLRVQADGFKPYESPAGKFIATPRNKNIGVYLNKLPQ